MESHNFHAFDWNSPRSSRIYDFPNSFEVGQNAQTVSGTVETNQQYHAPDISMTADVNHANFDSPMDDAPSMQSPLGGAPAGPPGNNTTRRSKYRHLDWEAHKGRIKQLYLDDDKTLAETMDIMKTGHSFEAS